jgi:hypothetical protein
MSKSSLTTNKSLLFNFGIAVFIVSCVSTTKLIHQYKVADSKIRFYVNTSPNSLKGEEKLFARVDSSNVRILYIFRTDRVFKTYDNNSNYLYSLSFDRQPMLKLTSIDSLVLLKADRVLDSLKYNEFMRSGTAKGFDIEVAGH